MEVFEAIRTVRAIRSYQDKPVPPEVIRQIVAAGRLTGSSMNGQPWHFIVVENRDTLQQLGSIARTGPYVAQAPMAVVVVLEQSRFAVSDASRAIQSMILTAWEAGVASNWVGFHGLEAARPLLGIPDNLEVFAIVPFGYPPPERAQAQGKKQRKPLNEVAHRERFGQPLEE